MSIISNLTPVQRAVAAVLVLLLLLNLAFVGAGWRAEQGNVLLEQDLEMEQDQLQRLRRGEDMAVLQKRLDQLQSEQASLPRLEPLVQVPNLDLLNEINQTGSQFGTRIVNFSSLPPASTTIADIRYDAYNFTVRIAGNSAGLISVLKRINDSRISTLRIDGFTATAVDNDWTTDVKLLAYAKPTDKETSVTPAATVTATATPAKSTPTPAKR